jgi:lysophospholipase L1-like esterase
VRAINRGIVGDTTSHVLHRLNSVVELHPDFIYLMIGTDDEMHGEDVAVAAQNYHRIVSEIQRSSPATVVYLQSILPTRNRRNANDWIRRMNAQIASIADNHSVFFVNMYDAFTEAGRPEMSARYSTDGTHLNGAGYQIWKQKLDPLLPR